MSSNSKTVAALQSIYERVLNLEASLNHLLAKEPEFKEAEKEQKTLESITSKLTK